MSTPTPPPEPDSAQTAAQPVDDQPAAPPESHAPVPGPQGPTPGAHPGMPGGPMAGYAYPHPYPFAPRVREPWINPAKRSALALVAVGLAIVLLAGGFIVGAAVGHHRDRGHSVQIRQLPGRVGGYGMPGRVPYGFIPRPGPHLAPRLHPGQGVPPATPVPSPTSSHR